MAVGARQRPFGSASDVGSCVADVRAVIDKGKRFMPAAICSGSSSSQAGGNERIATAASGPMPVPMHSLVGGVATSLIGGGAAGAFFNCAKCKTRFPMSECSARNSICKKDNASYKALADRMVKSKALKVWYDSMTPEQEVEWYRKQQARGPGKRTWEDTKFEEVAVKAAYQDEQEIDMMIPWKRFRRDGLAEGKALKTI